MALISEIRVFEVVVNKSEGFTLPTTKVEVSFPVMFMALPVCLVTLALVLTSMLVFGRVVQNTVFQNTRFSIT